MEAYCERSRFRANDLQFPRVSRTTEDGHKRKMTSTLPLTRRSPSCVGRCAEPVDTCPQSNPPSWRGTLDSAPAGISRTWLRCPLENPGQQAQIKETVRKQTTRTQARFKRFDKNSTAVTELCGASRAKYYRISNQKSPTLRIPPIPSASNFPRSHPLPHNVCVNQAS